MNVYEIKFSMPIINLLKSNIVDTELQKKCFIYCEYANKEYRRKNETSKIIVDYILPKLKNKNQIIQKSKWINLLLSTCFSESDLVLIHEVFFDNDNETKRYILDGMFKFCDAGMDIRDIKMQRLFYDICEDVYSWNDDYYTSRLLHYCLFTRTDDIFTVDEIFEKLNTVNDDVFNMFFSDIQNREFNYNFTESYQLNDDEKERIRNIIKTRKHPREKKMLELFN